MIDLRLVAYAPNGASLGPLPTPSSWDAAFPYGDVGALNLNYGRSAPRAELLGQPVEIAVEASHDGGPFAEVPDGRFLYLRDESDPLRYGADVLAAECPAYLWRFSKAYVGTTGLANDGKRRFLSQDAGSILKTLITEAQGRGALAGITHGTWSTTTDSNGVAWDKIITIGYDPTLDLLSVILNLILQGMIDVRMVGRDLRVYNAEALATDRTTQATPVTLREGLDLVEAPQRRTWEGLAKRLLLVGEGGVSLTRTNNAAYQPWGDWETTISHGGVSDTGTMTVLSDAELERGEAVRGEFTNGLVFASSTFLPFRDYFPGEYVYRGLDGALERLRVRSVTLSRSEYREIGGNVVLNDRFLEQEIRTARRVQGITGGAAADGGSGSRPAPPIDKGVPAAPTGVTATSASYLDENGRTHAQVTVSWAEVVENVDGTLADDVALYNVRWRRAGSVEGFALASVSGEVTSASASPLPPNLAIEVSVQAIDRDGHASAWSDWYAVTTDRDTVAPPTPSAPLAADYLGQVRVTWDGLNDVGASMPTDFDHVEVLLDATAVAFAADPGPDSAFLVGDLRGPGQFVVTNLIYGQSYAVALVAVDREGNRSPISPTAFATPERVTGLDVAQLAIDTEHLGDEAVTDAKIVNLAVTSAKIADLAVLRAKIADLAVDSAKIADVSAGKITAGKITAAWVEIGTRLTTAVGGAQSGARVELDVLGLRAYNSINYKTFDLKSDGTLYLIGKMEASTFATGLPGNRRVAIYDAATDTQSAVRFERADTPTSADSVLFSTDLSVGSYLTSSITLQSGRYSSTIGGSQVDVNPTEIALIRAGTDNNGSVRHNGEKVRMTFGPGASDAGAFEVHRSTLWQSYPGQMSPATRYYNGVGYGGAFRLRYTSGIPIHLATIMWDEASYIAHWASAFTVSSDVRNKRAVAAADKGKARAAVRRARVRSYERVTPLTRQGETTIDPETRTSSVGPPIPAGEQVTPELGFVAQELLADLPPDLRAQVLRGQEDDVAGLSVDVMGVVALLWAAVQDLDEQVQRLSPAPR